MNAFWSVHSCLNRSGAGEQSQACLSAQDPLTRLPPMYSTGVGSIFVILLWVLGLLALYFVIRLAVRHAIQDADARRRREQ
jgi:hypothetical protein